MKINQHTSRYRMAFQKKWLVPGLVVILILYFVLRPASDPDLQYKTEPVKHADLVLSVTATGTLQPTTQVDIGSEISGIVRAVEVDFNGQVSRGQVLAKLDTTRLEAQIRQSTAALNNAKAKLQQTQATLHENQARWERLQQAYRESDGKVPAKAEMDMARANVERASADFASAKASVDQAQAVIETQMTDLGKSSIKSPIKGVILRRAVDPGQTVAASFQTPVLFTIAEDLTKMDLHVDVDEADIGKVREKQTAFFTVDAYPNRTFPAVISQVRYGAKTTAGVITYETILKVDNSKLLLRPGMTATAYITVQKINNALVVPNAALSFSPESVLRKAEKPKRSFVSSLLPTPPGPRKNTDKSRNKKTQNTVWVLTEDHQAKPVPVVPGASDGSVTEILQGHLAVNTPVIVSAQAPKK